MSVLPCSLGSFVIPSPSYRYASALSRNTSQNTSGSAALLLLLCFWYLSQCSVRLSRKQKVTATKSRQNRSVSRDGMSHIIQLWRLSPFVLPFGAENDFHAIAKRPRLLVSNLSIFQFVVLRPTPRWAGGSKPLQNMAQIRVYILCGGASRSGIGPRPAKRRSGRREKRFPNPLSVFPLECGDLSPLFSEVARLAGDSNRFTCPRGGPSPVSPAALRRCLHDPAAQELGFLWDLAVHLDRLVDSADAVALLFPLVKYPDSLLRRQFGLRGPARTSSCG